MVKIPKIMIALFSQKNIPIVKLYVFMTHSDDFLVDY